VLYYAVFGGFTDYVYSLQFAPDTCKINNMVKVWNDGYAAAHEPGRATKAVAAVPVEAASCDTLSMEVNAQAFFQACENGLNWTATKEFVASEAASFNAQVTDAIPGFPTPVSKLTTVKGYTEWMAGVVNEFGAAATHTIKAKAADPSTSTMLYYAVFGGFTGYAYSIGFDTNCKINNMVKIWVAAPLSRTRSPFVLRCSEVPAFVSCLEERRLCRGSRAWTRVKP
jgi:hypothetical protein